MSLKKIFCQDKAISALQGAFMADKVAHAYIFTGIEGVGKFKTARQFAKLLLCKKPSTQKSFVDNCNTCQSCQLFEADSHPDYNHIYKELIQFTEQGKGRKTPVDLPIDVIREFLIDKAPIKPSLSQRKLFIITEAEKLNTASQNCLLKVLEEPPEYCCIILICTRLEKLLPTIKSRCQSIRFCPVDTEKIIEALTQNGLEATKAHYFAYMAQGSLGTACQWALLENAGTQLFETKKRLVKTIAGLEYTDSLDAADKISEDSKRISSVWADIEKQTSKTDISRRAANALIKIIISALADVTKLSLHDKNLTNSDQKAQIKALAQRFNPEQAAEKIIDCYRSLRFLEASVNEKLIFEQLLLNLADSDKMAV